MDFQIVDDIRARTEGLLDGVQKALDTIDDDLLMKPEDGWSLSKQSRRLLYGLDHRFVGPEVFREPEFQQADFMSPQERSSTVLTKAALMEYLAAISVRIESCLSAHAARLSRCSR